MNRAFVPSVYISATKRDGGIFIALNESTEPEIQINECVM